LACGFLSLRSRTKAGLVDPKALLFVNLVTRRLIASAVTANPDDKWVTQHTRHASLAIVELVLLATYTRLDYNNKFS
jgi:hypothetical protein